MTANRLSYSWPAPVYDGPGPNLVILGYAETAEEARCLYEERFIGLNYHAVKCRLKRARGPVDGWVPERAVLR